MKDKLFLADFNKYYNKKSCDSIVRKNELCISYFPVYSIENGIDWDANPFNSKTWEFHYHSLTWLYSYCYGIEQLKEEGLIDSLCRLIVGYFNYLANSVNKMAWFDHSVACRSSVISYIYVVLNKRNCNYVCNMLSQQAKTHSISLCNYLNDEKFEKSNHRIFHAQALHDLSIVFNFQALIDKSIRIIQNTYKKLFCSESSLTTEQSSFYNLFNLHLLHQSNRYFSLHQVSIFDKYANFIKTAYQSLLMLTDINGFYIPYGDTSVLGPIESNYLEQIWSIDKEKFLRDKSDQLDKVIDFHSFDFGLGLAQMKVLEKTTISLYYSAKKNRAAHGHYDSASFLLYFDGKPLVIEAGGPFGYGKQERYKYYMAELGHSMPVIGLSNQHFFTQSCERTRINDFFMVKLTSTSKSNKWVRSFLIFKCGVIAIIDDYLLEDNSQVTNKIIFSQEYTVSTPSDFYRILNEQKKCVCNLYLKLFCKENINEIVSFETESITTGLYKTLPSNSVCRKAVGKIFTQFAVFCLPDVSSRVIFLDCGFKILEENREYLITNIDGVSGIFL